MRRQPGRSRARSSAARATIHAPGELNGATRREMFDLLARHFVGVERAAFERDLDEKDWVVLVRDERGQVAGFTTLLRLEASVAGEQIVAFYSGDTIVQESARSSLELHRAWACHVWEMSRREAPARVFWFLVSCGYKTYRFLPIFFRTYYPAIGCESEDRLKRYADCLAQQRFPQEYDAGRGIVEFSRPTPLRSDVADVTPERLLDAHVAYYVARNPGHALGYGLACLAEICPDNLTPAAWRMLRGEH